MGGLGSTVLHPPNFDRGFYTLFFQSKWTIKSFVLKSLKFGVKKMGSTVFIFKNEKKKWVLQF